MNKLTVENYRRDKYYQKVVKAVNDELIHSNFVTPIQVFQRMQLLNKANVEKWRKGQVPFLEKVIMCGLGKTNRILKLIRFHAHDLNMKPSATIYNRKARSRKINLIFSKSGDKTLEEAYSRHFVKIGAKTKKKNDIGIGTAITDRPSHTTRHTDRVPRRFG